MVIVLPPAFDLPAGVEQIPEPARIQALLAQPAVEAFDVRILHRLARPDVNELQLPLQRPGQKRSRRKLGTVIAAQPQWRTTLADDAIRRALDGSTALEEVLRVVDLSDRM